jgi:predicted transposase/invertase (TIGR01784 family)
LSVKEEKGESPIRLLPLKSDVVFKMVFGDHRNVGILRAFLTAALDIPGDEFDKIEIIDTHLERDFPDDKLGILDVRVKTKNGKLVDIEIQLYEMPFMPERVTFYTCRNLNTQIAPGQTYEAVRKVVTILILDYDMLPDKARYHHKFRLYDPESGTLFTEVIEIHTLELKKLPDISNAMKPKETELLNWLKLIRAEDEEELEMLATKSPKIKETVAILKKLSANEEARLIYEAREKAQRDELTRLAGARTEGIAEGEYSASVKMAKNLLLREISPDIISESSGLSLEEIHALEEE